MEAKDKKKPETIAHKWYTNSNYILKLNDCNDKQDLPAINLGSHGKQIK